MSEKTSLLANECSSAGLSDERDSVFVERLSEAIVTLQSCVEADRETRGGVPVLKGTRITVARILAEVSAGLSVSEIADDLDLDHEQLQRLFSGLADYFNRPLAK